MADDIRVELIRHGAQDLYRRKPPDISEIYSHPRVCAEATSQMFNGVSLKPGWSLDLTGRDPNSQKPWDLSDKKVQAKVKKLIRDTEPLFVVGSPPCTAFSQLQGLNKGRRPQAVIDKEFRAGREHIRFSLEVYAMQV